MASVESVRRVAKSWDESRERAAARLPTKAAAAVLTQTVPLSKPAARAEKAADSASEEDAVASDVDEDVAVDPVKAEKLSMATLLRRRETVKLEIAESAQQVLAAPEKALTGSTGPRPLKILMNYCTDQDFVVQKLAMVSVMRVLVDIIPGYRIRLPTEKELAMPVTKDVRKLREYEGNLLASYKRFVQLLAAAGATVKGAPQDEAARSVAVTAARCLCELMKSVPHFNHRDELIDAVIAKAGDRIDEVALPVVAAITELFRSDVDPGATSRATSGIVRLVRSRGTAVRPALLDALVALPASTASTRPDVKKRKRTPGLDEDLESEEDIAAERATRHASALKDVLAVYFLLLRSKGTCSSRNMARRCR